MGVEDAARAQREQVTAALGIGQLDEIARL
jgi:hypothetical protein